MKTDDNLAAEVEDRVKMLGFDLIDLRKKGSARRVILEVRVDLLDPESGNGVTVDQCTTVSRGLEERLDEVGGLGENDVLEVSSRGIERPVRWARTWLGPRGGSPGRHGGDDCTDSPTASSTLEAGRDAG